MRGSQQRPSRDNPSGPHSHSRSLDGADRSSRQHPLPHLPALDTEASPADERPGWVVTPRGASADHSSHGTDLPTQRITLSEQQTGQRQRGSESALEEGAQQTKTRGRPADASQARALVPRRTGALRPAATATSAPLDDQSRQLALRETRGGAVMLSPTGEAQGVLIHGTKKVLRSHSAYVVPRRHGALSFMAQFVISMVTTAVIVTAIAAASPLGQGVAGGESFRGYANAVPWVPTPTPTPSPTPTPKPYVPPPPPGGYDPGQQAIIADIESVFGNYAPSALIIARCESGYNPNAWNPYPIGNSHASGVFQILYPSTWSTTPWAGQSPNNADANIHAAYQIFSRDGNSWREWACAAQL